MDTNIKIYLKTITIKNKENDKKLNCTIGPKFSLFASMLFMSRLFDRVADLTQLSSNLFARIDNSLEQINYCIKVFFYCENIIGSPSLSLSLSLSLSIYLSIYLCHCIYIYIYNHSKPEGHHLIMSLLVPLLLLSLWKQLYEFIKN